MPETDSTPGTGTVIHAGTVIHTDALAHCANCPRLMARARLAQDGDNLLCPACAGATIRGLRAELEHGFAGHRDVYLANSAVIAALMRARLKTDAEVAHLKAENELLNEQSVFLDAEASRLETEVARLNSHLHPKYDPTESED